MNIEVELLQVRKDIKEIRLKWARLQHNFEMAIEKGLPTDIRNDLKMLLEGSVLQLEQLRNKELELMKNSTANGPAVDLEAGSLLQDTDIIKILERPPFAKKEYSELDEFIQLPIKKAVILIQATYVICYLISLFSLGGHILQIIFLIYNVFGLLLVIYKPDYVAEYAWSKLLIGIFEIIAALVLAGENPTYCFRHGPRHRYYCTFKGLALFFALIFAILFIMFLRLVAKYWRSLNKPQNEEDTPLLAEQ